MMLQNICKVRSCPYHRDVSPLDTAQTCSRVLLTEEQRRVFLDRFRRPHLENQQRQRLAKEINTLCRKEAARICVHCGSTNGAVKKTGALRIQHDRFAGKKMAEQKEHWVGTFNEAIKENRDLGAHISKTQEDLNALKVLSLFRRVSASVRPAAGS